MNDKIGQMDEERALLEQAARRIGRRIVDVLGDGERTLRYDSARIRQLMRSQGAASIGLCRDNE